LKNFDTIFSKENKPNHSWFAFTNHLKSYRAVDDYTFEIVLDTPYTATLYDLAMIRPIRFLGDAGFPENGDTSKGIKKPVGTGAWVLKEHKNNEYAVFVRNEYYWGEKPAASEVVIKNIPDSETLALQFEAGDIDLIYGLPRQTLEDIQYNLDIVKDLPINHISTYGLQVEVGTYLYHLVQKNLISIPSETIDESMYEMMMDGLKALGFERYEISNFAKTNSYSRHNLKYWHYVDYLGFGAGAHSFYDGVRRSNNRNVMPYIQSVDRYIMPTIDTETITLERAQEDFCFLALRTKWGLDERKFEDKFGVSVHNLFGTTLEDLVSKDLLEYQSGSYHLTAEGAKHGNYVFSQFIRE